MTVPGTLLGEYAGHYEGVWAEGGFYSNAGPGYPYRAELRLRSGGLWLTHIEDGEYGRPMELLARSESRFVLPAEGSVIEFERDESGAVVRYRARYGLDEWVMRRLPETANAGQENRP